MMGGNIEINLNITFNESFVYDGINLTNNTTDDIFNIIYYPAVQVLFYIMYFVIFTLGVFGNVLVCYVVILNKSMQNVTNFFITNLALSDILLCILAVPFTPIYSFLKNWIFGTLLCHTVPYAQGVSVYISSLTLTSIAVDRYFVIIYPFKSRMAVSVCLMLIVCIWLFAIVATLPYGIFMKLQGVNGNLYCDERWPDEMSRQIFGGCTTVLQFIIPFIVITFCYVRVSNKLSDRARAKPGVKSSRREEAERERKRRTNRMLIAMVAIFGMSWFPLNLVNLLNDVTPETVDWDYFYLVFFIAHAIAMSSTCYNPFLYAWLNENFRKEFKQVLPCFSLRASVGRIGAYRSERTCNGNDTVQETLLPANTNSLKDDKLENATEMVQLDYQTQVIVT